MKDDSAKKIDIKIDPEMVEKYIFDLAKFGAVEETGVTRLVYSPEWVAATDAYANWCEEIGLSVTRDAVGNVWGKLEGSEPGKSVASGSHIDSQFRGGRYDGHLGALAALIAVRALKEQYGKPRRSIEAVALCEEESSRFPNTNFWGSRAITGNIPEGLPETLKGYEDETIAEAMRSVGLDPAKIPTAYRDDIEYWIELHIEQGPILEQADLPCAIVDAITGIRQYAVTLKGVQNHAGGFPMDIRNDPMAGFAEIASGVVNTAHRMGRPAVTTVGRVVPYPNRPAVIPREVFFTIDVRHPVPALNAKIYADHEAMMKEVAARRGLEISWEYFIDHPPCLSDPKILEALKSSANAQGIPHMVMASGAGHDSQQMAQVAKVAMVFVRSEDGRSHTPEEYSSIPDIVEGIRLMAGAIYELAYR